MFPEPDGRPMKRAALRRIYPMLSSESLVRIAERLILLAATRGPHAIAAVDRFVQQLAEAPRERTPLPRPARAGLSIDRKNRETA